MNSWPERQLSPGLPPCGHRGGAGSVAARVARIDAGPGAIALTPLAAGWPARAPDGWVSKGERWLLKERIDDAGVRLERVEQALEEWREAA